MKPCQRILTAIPAVSTFSAVGARHVEDPPQEGRARSRCLAHRCPLPKPNVAHLFRGEAFACSHVNVTTFGETESFKRADARFESLPLLTPLDDFGI